MSLERKKLFDAKIYFEQALQLNPDHQVSFLIFLKKIDVQYWNTVYDSN